MRIKEDFFLDVPAHEVAKELRTKWWLSAFRTSMPEFADLLDFIESKPGTYADR
jgi:hypothetical protein